MRKLLLESAIVEFAATGYSGTPTRAIADRADVTTSTLYHHFGTKRSLYVEASKYAIASAYEQFEAAVVGLGSLRDELIAVLRCATVIVHDHYEITAMAIRARTDLTIDEVDPEFRSQVTRDFEARMIERAIARGELDPEDSVLAQMLIASVLWGLSMISQDQTSSAAVIAAFERIINATLATS